MTKPADPFQIARMERVRELLAVNSGNPAILAETAPAPTENQRGTTLSCSAQQAIEQGTIEEPNAEAGRGSRTLAENVPNLGSRRASEIILAQSARSGRADNQASELRRASSPPSARNSLD